MIKRKCCIVCGKPFTKKQLLYQVKKYCSQKCHNKGQTGIKMSETTKQKLRLKAIERLKDKTKNPMYGKHHTQATKDLISKANTGKKRTKKQIKQMSIRLLAREMKGINHPLWKGDNVGYTQLHAWIRTYYPKPKLCEICKKKPPYDLANISGEYKRDINDFRWLCRKCHMKSDGRYDKLKQQKGTHHFLKRDSKGRFMKLNK